jgi:hypothetical protein
VDDGLIEEFLDLGRRKSLSPCGRRRRQKGRALGDRGLCADASVVEVLRGDDLLPSVGVHGPTTP